MWVSVMLCVGKDIVSSTVTLSVSVLQGSCLCQSPGRWASSVILCSWDPGHVLEPGWWVSFGCCGNGYGTSVQWLLRAQVQTIRDLQQMAGQRFLHPWFPGEPVTPSVLTDVVSSPVTLVVLQHLADSLGVVYILYCTLKTNIWRKCKRRRDEIWWNSGGWKWIVSTGLVGGKQKQKDSYGRREGERTMLENGCR